MSHTAFSAKFPPAKPKNTDRRAREYLTPAEVTQLMRAARHVGRHGHRNATLILLMYRHGLRVSEVTSLRWDAIDWKTALVHDRDRHRVGERAIDHDGASLAQLAAWLWTVSAGQPQRVAVAIEVPRGAIVEGLLERGFHLFAINPKQLDRFRDRHSVAGAKDDRRDAFVLADSLRTDRV